MGLRFPFTREEVSDIENKFKALWEADETIEIPNVFSYWKDAIPSLERAFWMFICRTQETTVTDSCVTTTTVSASRLFVRISGITRP